MTTPISVLAAAGAGKNNSSKVDATRKLRRYLQMAMISTFIIVGYNEGEVLRNISWPLLDEIDLLMKPILHNYKGTDRYLFPAPQK